MADFKFNITVSNAASYEDAKKLAQAAVDIMKSARTQVSDKQFCELAEKIKADPGVVQTALNFL